MFLKLLAKLETITATKVTSTKNNYTFNKNRTIKTQNISKITKK